MIDRTQNSVFTIRCDVLPISSIYEHVQRETAERRKNTFEISHDVLENKSRVPAYNGIIAIIINDRRIVLFNGHALVTYYWIVKDDRSDSNAPAVRLPARYILFSRYNR